MMEAHSKTGEEPPIGEGVLKEMTARWLPPDQVPRRIRIHTDTTDFFSVEYDDVLILAEHPYLIRHNAKEWRFGLEDEVKYWVKRAIDLEDGATKIIKLVFYEKFVAEVGGIAFECFRSPNKEARILDLVGNHQNFMHGFATSDEKGNVIRVLEFIKGKTVADHIHGMTMSHESYFHEQFPGILENFLECVEAIRFLHGHGEKHGDIRRDHILIDSQTGIYRWIDFDFNYRHRENIYGYDLFGLGNILAFLVGKGDVRLNDLKRELNPALGRLGKADLNIVFSNRVANLQKIYPYIPDSLNKVLLHFSAGANWFYETTDQLLEDLGGSRGALRGAKKGEETHE
jgi:serine/threonine protein kinase